jgi:hypothetical protein
MIAVHIRRGPWGYLEDGAEEAHICINSLAQLPGILERDFRTMRECKT